MTLCPHCQTSNPPDSNFCQQCGKSITTQAPATVLLTAGQGGARGPRQQRFELAPLFARKGRLLIGRAPDCDIVLPHPSVSRYHARLEQRPGGLLLNDLSSVNGVWLGGRRIGERSRVLEGDRIGIGPYLLSISAGVLHALDNSRGLRLEARVLEKVVALPNGGTRKLLDDVNLVVNPGEFVTLLGPSGSGKSTLMDCLNGRRPATGGRVLANGEDFYRHLDSFRRSLGYVPQRDIVHTGLTVYRALYYTAQLRLPVDTDPDELQARVEAVLGEMELTAHRDTLVANLSGGQIKRVSLGAELLAQPSILYIDEATSGLDAGTEARMMRLFRRLADEGRSIICITHNVDNVDQCHLVLVLARGKLIYYGPPGEAPRYFGVRRISDIYDRIGERDLAAWEEQFRRSDLYRAYVVERLALPNAPQATAPLPESETPAEEQPEERRPLHAFSQLLADSRKLMERFPPLAERFRQLEVSWLHWRERLAVVGESVRQFRVLTARYLELIWSDRRGLRLLLLQAPVVALFLLLGFIGKDFREPMPILRPLTSAERNTLIALRRLDRTLDSDQPLTDEQKKGLARVRLRAGGIPVGDGEAALRLLRRLAREDLSDEQKQALKELHFQVEEDGEPTTVSALEMVEAWRRLHESRVPDRLLQMRGSVVPEGEWVNPRYTYMLLFILTMIVLWFGCNNAAKEIVKEEAVYARERAVNLHILPYLASKFVVLGAITILHAGLLLLVVYGTLEVLAWQSPHHTVPRADTMQLMLGYGGQFGVMVVLSMTSVALGLLISACVATPDRANALLPYVLIPQMILGGGILSVNSGALHWLAVTLSPVYWGFRAVHLNADRLSKDFPMYRDYPDGVLLPCLALAAQALALLAATAFFMKRKDV